jgi:hypothetical protein
VDLGGGYYESTDELTGTVSKFQIKPYPIDSFIRLWKFCAAKQTGERRSRQAGAPTPR